AAGVGRAGAGHRCVRFLLRRLRRDVTDRACRAAARDHRIGPAEYFSLMVCGLIAAVVLARRSLLKAIAMVVLGLLLGLVGTDVNSSARRFNFGMTGLADGIEFVAISMAIYGIAEVVYNLEQKQAAKMVTGALGRVWPSFADVKQCAGSILRGTGLGAI